MTISLLAIVSLVAGILLFVSTDKPLPKELSRMMMWCGFLVLLFEVAGWHALYAH